MTELEKIAYTKSFIDQMANGIDPLTGQNVPESDLINNVRISRCMFYVSDLLRQILDNGGIGQQKSKKAQKLPFMLPVERRSAFDFSDLPIPASEIAKRVNALLDDPESMVKLTYAHIRSWLGEIGALEEVTSAEGKSRWVPTAQGGELGITVVLREGRNGPYQAVVYSREAQQFILDNLDGVAAAWVERKAAGERKPSRPWTKEQDSALITLFRGGFPVEEMARKLERSEGGIRARLKRLGLIEQRGDAE